MKKITILAFLSILFILAAADLSAQIPKESTIYTLPVKGKGTKEAKLFIHDRIIYEIAFNDFPIQWGRRGSDFVVRGTIYPVKEGTQFSDPPTVSKKSKTGDSSSGNRREFISWEVRNPVIFYDVSSNRDSDVYETEYVLILELMAARTNEIIDERPMVFNHLNQDLERGISEIMYEFFYGIPHPDSFSPEVEFIPAHIAMPFPEEEEIKRQRSKDWRDKFLFVKTCVLWSPTEGTDGIEYLNFGVNLSLEFQYSRFFTVEFGAQLVQTSGIKDFSDFIFEFPLALKGVIRPIEELMIEPYIGVSINMTPNDNIGNIEEMANASRYSFFGGLEFCVRAGFGSIVIDPRIVADWDTWSTFIFSSGLDILKYFQLHLGYKVGFFTKLEHIRRKR